MLEKLYVELLYIHLLTLSIFRVVSEIDTAFTVRKSHINLDCKFGEQFIFPEHSTLLSKLFQKISRIHPFVIAIILFCISFI